MLLSYEARGDRGTDVTQVAVKLHQKACNQGIPKNFPGLEKSNNNGNTFMDGILNLRFGEIFL